MPRKTQWPPSIIHHKKSGQARVRHRGKDYYLGPWGSEKARKAYADLISRLAGQPDALPEKPASGLLVSEAIELWEAGDGPRLAWKERWHFRRALELVAKAAGRVKLAEFGVSHLRQARDLMIGLGWCAKVVNRHVTRVRTAWRWLEEQGHAPRGSWEHLRCLRGLGKQDHNVRHRPPRRAATWAELVALCRAAPVTIRAMLLLGWFTGARPGEICQMRPCDLDRADPGCWLYRPRTHKNAWRGHDRVILLDHVCQKIVAPFLHWRRRTPKEHLFIPSQRCRQRKRRYYAGSAYVQAVARAAARAGVRVCAYQLRHSAKQRFTRLYGLDVARALLGQTSIETTNDYAAGADLELARRAVRKSA